MNTFDQIINEIARIDCGRVAGLHVALSPRAMRGLSIQDWSILRYHGITTSAVNQIYPGFHFAIIEPRNKQLQCSL